MILIILIIIFILFLEFKIVIPSIILFHKFYCYLNKLSHDGINYELVENGIDDLNYKKRWSGEPIVFIFKNCFNNFNRTEIDLKNILDLVYKELNGSNLLGRDLLNICVLESSLESTRAITNIIQFSKYDSDLYEKLYWNKNILFNNNPSRAKYDLIVIVYIPNYPL